MENKKISFVDLVKKRLDGRKNIWLSNKTGISQSEISRILSGRLIPSDNQKKIILDSLPKDTAKI